MYGREGGGYDHDDAALGVVLSPIGVGLLLSGAIWAKGGHSIQSVCAVVAVKGDCGGWVFVGYVW